MAPRRIAIAFAVVLIAAPAAAGATVSAHVITTGPRAATSLTGAGSTFVAPLMNGKWIPDYTSLHSGVTITYNAVGSGNGIIAWTKGTANYAASDALLTSAQDQAAAAHCGGSTVKIPATISAVAIIYNVPGVPNKLRLSPAVLANIFLGRITNWNDPAIQAINKGTPLPNLAIQVVHRSDGSGTTYITTNYLSAVSPTWKSGPGAGAKVVWPVGAGAKGSAGIVTTVSTTLGAISYVDLAFAKQDNLDYATVQNAQGAYIEPAVSTAGRAAASFASSMPSDLQQVIVNSTAASAYPITGYSYIFLCARQTGATGAALVDFVRYVVTQGQSGVDSIFYAPLPASVQRLDTTALAHISLS